VKTKTGKIRVAKTKTKERGRREETRKK